jgi:hypothetical protein
MSNCSESGVGGVAGGTPRGARQARIRNEYAAWYPTLSVVTWVPARTVARKVARHLLDGEPSWAPRWAVGPRLLDPAHFEFRRGHDRDPTVRTRLGEVPPEARRAETGNELRK